MAETVLEMIEQGVDITITLSITEKRSLKEYEQVISKGLNTFLEVGHALAEIRDQRLYRETHRSFESYCKEYWDLSRGRAYQQISGYETVTLLENKMSTIVDKNESEEITLPINESQTRPLTKLKDPDDQVKAWGIVLDKLNQDPKAKLTTALISKAVKEVKGEAIKRTVEETKEAVDKTVRVSNVFKKQYQILLEIIVGAQNENWKTMKKTEVIKHLEALIKIVKEEN